MGGVLVAIELGFQFYGASGVHPCHHMARQTTRWVANVFGSALFRLLFIVTSKHMNPPPPHVLWEQPLLFADDAIQIPLTIFTVPTGPCLSKLQLMGAVNSHSWSQASASL